MEEIVGNPIPHFNGFMQETDFDNFISMVGGDPIEKFSTLGYPCENFSNCCTDLDLQLPPPVNVGGFDDHVMWKQESLIGQEGTTYDHEVYGDDDHSSETVTTGNTDTPPSRRSGGAKGDRTRTLISERKRRSGMKEKLYALRSLVPNITKMDKASIVGDAARYIQDLQTQAKILKADIATIEAANSQKLTSQNSKNMNVSNSLPIFKKISKMEIFQVEEKGYYVRLVCNKGRGVAASLHKALESITSFQVQSSNLATNGDNFVLTFTLNVMVCEFELNLPNLKLWLAGAFLNQGFEFTTFPST